MVRVHSKCTFNAVTDIVLYEIDVHWLSLISSFFTSDYGLSMLSDLQKKVDLHKLYEHKKTMQT